MTCKECRYAYSVEQKGKVNQWKKIVEAGSFKWYCKQMCDVDYRGRKTGRQVELETFEPCELFMKDDLYIEEAHKW